MSLFAKIMVVVNFILAVVFLSAAGTFLGAMNKYKDMHAAEKDKHAEDVATLEAQVGQRQKELDAAKARANEHEVARTAAEAAQATQAESLKTLNDKNAQLQAALDRFSNTYDVVVANNDKLQQEKAALQDQVNTARADARTARDELDTANQTNQGLEQQVSDLEKAIDAAQKANQSLTDKVDQQATALTVYAERYGPLPAAATEVKKINGRVQAGDAKMDIYVISVGAKDDVKVGYEFVVYRGNEYVSTIVVDQVFDNHASCRTKSGLRKSDVKAGDQVTTRL